MKYYIAKTVNGDFATVVNRAIESLKAEGFGVLTDIDVRATMKKKLLSAPFTITISALWRNGASAALAEVKVK